MAQKKTSNKMSEIKKQFEEVTKKPLKQLDSYTIRVIKEVTKSQKPKPVFNA